MAGSLSGAARRVARSMTRCGVGVGLLAKGDGPRCEEFAVAMRSRRAGGRGRQYENAWLDAATAGDGPSMLDMLSDPMLDLEVQTVNAQRNEFVRSVLNEALVSFDSRERLIVKTGLFADDDELSLADLGRRLGVSRERVRQLEERTKSKLRNAFAAVTNCSFDFGFEALCA